MKAETAKTYPPDFDAGNEQTCKPKPTASVIFEIDPFYLPKFKDVDEFIKKILDAYSGRCEVQIKVARIRN